MFVTINDNDLNVEVLGADDAPVLIAHHGGGGIGSLDEPKATFGPLADEMRVVPGYDLKPLLPGVRCPTLVTVGRTDWVTPVRRPRPSRR
jgi:hypothetical protein